MSLLSSLNKIFIFISFFLSNFLFANAAPVPAKFFVSSFVADVGQVVEFELRIEGNENIPIYKVISNLDYDKNLLTFKNSSYQTGWTPTIGGDVTDTLNGVIKRTADYPTGLKKLTSLIKYTFVAKAPGVAKVNIIGGSAYDINNNDLGLQNKSITVKIGDKKEEIKNIDTITEEKSSQVLTLDLMANNGFSVGKDYNILIRHNLKINQSTNGTTSVSILNTEGLEIYNETRDFLISENREMVFTIPANTIAPGNYVLKVTSQYDNQKNLVKIIKEIGAVGVSEKIVNKEVKTPYIPIFIWIIIAILILIIAFMTTYSRSKAFRKFIKNF